MVDPLDYLRGEVKDDSIREKTLSGILVYGASKKLQQEAQRLADMLGAKIEQTSSASLQKDIAIKNPEIILLEESDETLDIASRLSQRLKIGLVTGCMKLEIDYSKLRLLCHRPSYAGKAIEVVACKTKPQMVMLTMRDNA